MGLFKKTSPEEARKRELERRKREREKRNQAYEKKQKKEDAKAQQKQKPIEETFGYKVLNFMSATIDLFVPAKTRIGHKRLVQQGAVFAICLACLSIGFGISYTTYKHKQAIQDAIQSFANNTLVFSKTQTEVKTSQQPFMTQDKKTVYVPLSISNLSNIDSDASEYHIIMLPKKGEFTYHPTSIQLVSYGSTGKMFLRVDSADQIQNQLVQIIMWSGTKLTNDSYDGSEDTDNEIASSALAKFKSKYDTLAFTINLGAKSIPIIQQNKKVQQEVTKLVKNKDTKKLEKKKVMITKTVPIKENQNLYNDNKLQFIYNRIYSGAKLKKVQKHVKNVYNNMLTNQERVRRDWKNLKTAGYKMPTLPEWITSPANNLSDGLPLDLQQIQNLNFMNNPFIESHEAQTKINTAYNIDKQQNNNSDSDSDDAKTKEQKYIEKMSNLIIKDSQGNIIGNQSDNGDSSGDDQADDDTTNSGNSGKTAEDQWADLQQAVKSIYDEKDSIYRRQVLKIWGQYKEFQTATSSGSELAKRQNIGAITYSKTTGHNTHGRFMLIAGVPKVTEKKGK